jgi:hypothetical protein
MAAAPETDLHARMAAVLASLPEVELAYLFGSHAQGRPRPESDVDLGIQVSGEAAARSRATLAELFDRLGAVARSDRLDVVLLNSAPPLLRQRILATGKLLFARSPETRVRFATRTIREHQDMQTRREFFYRKRVERLREGRDDGRSRDLLAEARRAARLLGKTPSLPGDD